MSVLLGGALPGSVRLCHQTYGLRRRGGKLGGEVYRLGGLEARSRRTSCEGCARGRLRLGLMLCLNSHGDTRPIINYWGPLKWRLLLHSTYCSMNGVLSALQQLRASFNHKV